jgi:hypothetical protein
MKIKLSKNQWEEVGRKAGWMKKAEHFDDNFGKWNSMEGEEEEDFYRQVQKESVWKICKNCGRKVKIRPQYSICNSCAEKIERGEQF